MRRYEIAAAVAVALALAVVVVVAVAVAVAVAVVVVVVVVVVVAAAAVAAVVVVVVVAAGGGSRFVAVNFQLVYSMSVLNRSRKNLPFFWHRRQQFRKQEENFFFSSSTALRFPFSRERRKPRVIVGFYESILWSSLDGEGRVGGGAEISFTGFRHI